MKFEPTSGITLDPADSGPHARAGELLPPCDGSIALAASPSDRPALAPDGDDLTRMSTMFFAALSDMSTGRPSLVQIEGAMLRYGARRRHADVDGGPWRRYPTPTPQLLVGENPRLAPLKELKLFPAWRTGPALALPTRERADVFTLLIVEREEGSRKLVTTVEEYCARQADPDFVAETNRLLKVAEREGARLAIERLSVDRAFIRIEDLETSIAAVCAADLAVFDATATARGGIEPGIMFLLGARAVARRGVTICSVDRDPRDIYTQDLPFNVQYVNLTTHSDLYTPEVGSIARFSQKVEAAYRDLHRNPTYLDLPAYDAARNLGTTVEDFGTISYYLGPIYLGPFERWTQKRCFDELSLRLETRLQQIIKHKYTREREKPLIARTRRLVEADSNRLVIQSLYVALRRYEFCLVDWTLLRPNAFFELGARLVANRTLPVHIIATLSRETPDQGEDKRSFGPLHENELSVRWLEPYEVPAHVKSLRQHFDLIVSDPDDPKQLRENVGQILERRKAISAQPNRFYAAAGRALRPTDASPLSELVDELSQRAKLAALRNEDDHVPTVIYADQNDDLRIEAEVKAICLSLAAMSLELLGGRFLDLKRLEAIDDALSRMRLEIGELQKRVSPSEDLPYLRAARDFMANIVLQRLEGAQP
jgi:hypothetical protein